MTDILVRPSEIDDISAIQKIYKYGVLNGIATFDTVQPTKAELQDKRQTISENGFPYLVTEKAGR